MKSRRKPLLSATVESLECRQLLSGTPGSLDTTFNTTGVITDSSKPAVAHLGIQSSGAIVVAGTPSPTNGLLTRYTSAGALDTGFNGSGSRAVTIGSVAGFARDVLIQSGDKIVLTGSADNRVVLFRFNADGTNDNTFDGGAGFENITGIVGEAEILGQQSDGSLIVGGNDNSGNVIISKFTSDGVLVNGFGTSGTTTISGPNLQFTDLAVQSDNKIVVVYNNSSTNVGHVVRLTALGAVDSTTFTNPISGNSEFNGVTTSGSSIIVAGTNGTDPVVVRYVSSSGAVDTTFGTSGVATLSAGSSSTADLFRVTLDGNGEILATGELTTGSNQQLLVERLTSSGAADNTFGSGGIGLTPSSTEDVQSNDIAVQSDGNIVVAGGSPTQNHETIARFLGGTVGGKPTATVAPLGTVRKNSSTFTFQVDYHSPAGQLIDKSTLTLNSVEVSGQGSLFHPTSQIIGRQRTGGTLSVVYTVNLPAGQFVNNRKYGLILSANQVADIDGMFADVALLGTFNVRYGSTLA